MSTLRQALVATAPTRLDFGGGWTDVPPYPEERGGFVCNLAIERRATVRVEPHGPESNDPLVRAALKRAGLLVDTSCDTLDTSSDTRDNTRPSIRHVLSSIGVQLTSDYPVGAGLGGSSAASVALAAAMHAILQRSASAAELAEWSRAMEVEELGIAGGFQDHYAAAYGGALGLTFGHTNSAEVIPLSDALIDALEQQIVLLYTGESRISSATITAVRDAYRDRAPGVIQALERMGALARDMRDALVHADVAHLAACVHEHWHHQRALHPAITTDRIDAIERAAYGAGAIAMKALGASGGGCVIVFTPPECRDSVVHAVSHYAERLDWHVAQTGVVVR